LKSDKENLDKENFSVRNRRDKVINRVSHALEKAGREAEIIPLCQCQADQTHDGYMRFIKHLRNEILTTSKTLKPNLTGLVSCFI
jgi:uncharacterized Zn finger protein